MVVPANPNGWYHNGNMGVRGAPDKNHSAFKIRQLKSGRFISLLKPSFAPFVVLTTGEKNWRDFSVSAVVAVRDILPVGVVIRYRTNRDFYAAIFESGVFKLVRVFEGVVTVLDSKIMKTGKKPFTLSLSARGSKISATVSKIELSSTDSCIHSGGIGLWANGPADFGIVKVKTSKKEIERIQREKKQARSEEHTSELQSH